MTTTPPTERTQETIEITAQPQEGRLILEVHDDEGLRRVPLPDGPASAPIVLGTARAASIRMRDVTVSAQHCSIARAPGGFIVRDLGSRNGTYVGGARVREAWGAEGTTITIGQSTIVCAPERAHDEVALGEPLPGIAGCSLAMRRIAGTVRRLAHLSAPVLVTGETGVGKELVVRALHGEGPRRQGPFVAMNVSALPRELVESELFGHERGAFTGAISRRVGAFTEAETGTLFLDEIGELPLDAQPKLLRALDGYEVRRVGSAGSGRRTNARVIAATHVALLDRVEAGLFRRDLYHRLEVFVIEVPPLRERRGDVLPIARVLLAQMANEVGRRELTPSAIAQLTAHDWPGNVRELRNALSRAAHLCDGKWLDASYIERGIRRVTAPKPVRKARLTMERAREMLTRHEGNVSAASRALGISRTTFRKALEGR
jgi:DNA-binding NtrC family response regulator